jgi:hypothetical protein
MTDVSYMCHKKSRGPNFVGIVEVEPKKITSGSRRTSKSKVGGMI